LVYSLFDNQDRIEVVKKAIGKKIAAIAIVDNRLILSFEDKTRLELRDDGQTCCEYRYMNTDDALPDFVGGILQDLELSAAHLNKDNDENLDSQFLKVVTSKGTFTVVNYNEHNGHYGGFSIQAQLL
jgi:hypothetical protein